MSGEMDPERLKVTREMAAPDKSGRVHNPLLAELLIAHDHHRDIAEQVKGEAARALDELDSVKRERDEAQMIAHGRASVLESVRGDLEANLLVRDVVRQVGDAAKEMERERDDARSALAPIIARAEEAEAEAAQLLAEVAELKDARTLREERDSARRELCDRAGKYASPGHGNPGHKVIARSIACASGWAYLYPEEKSK